MRTSVFNRVNGVAPTLVWVTSERTSDSLLPTIFFRVNNCIRRLSTCLTAGSLLAGRARGWKLIGKHHQDEVKDHQHGGLRQKMRNRMLVYTAGKRLEFGLNSACTSPERLVHKHVSIWNARPSSSGQNVSTFLKNISFQSCVNTISLDFFDFWSILPFFSSFGASFDSVAQLC